MRFGASRGMDRERPLINMVSMIDATFLLLSFFLVTTGATMLEGRLTGALGTAAGASGDLQAVVVEVLGTPGAASTGRRRSARRCSGCRRSRAWPCACTTAPACPMRRRCCRRRVTRGFFE